MNHVRRPRALRRAALGAAAVLIIAGSQWGMLWLANAYLDADRGSSVLSVEALCGLAAIVLALMSARFQLRPAVPRVVRDDAIGRCLFAFLAVCIAGELLRPDRTLDHISTFVSIGAYYLIGIAVGRWFCSDGCRLPVVAPLLAIYTVWYAVLLVFYLRGDLGFYGVLPDSDVLRLEFRSGFTATELPIFMGFQLPVVLYVLVTDKRALHLLWAGMLLACAATLAYLSASSAAMAAFLLVVVVALLARQGATWTGLLRVLAVVGAALVAMAFVAAGVLDSSQAKLQAFFSSEGIRALIYADLIDIIESQPAGIGKSRFVETNNFSWLGEGVFPHNNILGIGAEMGVLAMALFLVLCLAVLIRLGRVALLRDPQISRRCRSLVAIGLAVFVYQQFRGLFQDTWVIKETYFWMGMAAGAAMAVRLPRSQPARRSLSPMALAG